MKLLVPVDLSDSSRLVINRAKELAQALSAKIWLLHVADPDPDFIGYESDTQSLRDGVAEKFHKEHSELQQFSQELRSIGLDCVALLIQGPTVETILNEAGKLSVDVIAIGSHGKGAMKRFLVGSTSEGVLHKSVVPVLVIPTHGRSKTE